jgi:lysophospholipase L1-like esterase
MNQARRVFLFVSISLILYVIISFAGIQYGIDWHPLNRINLLSEIITPAKQLPAKQDSVTLASIDSSTIRLITKRNFNVFNTGHNITDFSADATAYALPNVMAKLYALKSGKKTKLRIAYLGDSMIEGDLLTQTFRKLMQQQFGGNGVGFVPVASQVSKFRATASDDFSNSWTDEHFKNAGAAVKANLFLSGHVYTSNNAWVRINDNTIQDSAALIEKSMLCGHCAANTTVQYNKQPITVSAPDKFNRITLSTDHSRDASVSVSSDQLPVYGISFESESGVFVDNFSFRGISGIELAAIDTSFLQSVAQNNPYDLIIFQYGVNVLFRPNDKKFSWYEKALSPVINKFKNCFPKTDIIVVSTADRAFRYNGVYQSATGIDSLIKIQASVAFDNGVCFYNQFASMGGKNSIVDWAAKTPSLANKDYVHPNHRGAEVLAGYFYEAIMKDYNKYITASK